MSRYLQCYESVSLSVRDGFIVLHSREIAEFATTGFTETSKRKPWNPCIALFWVVALALAITAQAKEPHAYKLEGDINGAHDPSIAREGKTYYVFTTGKASDGGQLGIRCSEDLAHWRHCGHVFDVIPPWIKERSPGTKDLWAPDISYANGRYRLYYAYSLFGKNTSGIALVTNKTLDPASPDYKWQDEGLILESAATDNYNAIDPNYIEDVTHHAWLSFGSFWTGIKLRALDEKTGKLARDDEKTYSLASRKPPEIPGSTTPGLPANWQAIEAPFIVHRGRYYYLFVSFDLCCRGLKSTYKTMVGRARNITGPYIDRDGVYMSQGGGTLLLNANSLWLGPGGQSVLIGKHAPDLIVFHGYDHIAGKPALQVSTLTWKDDWPHASLDAR
jgi:arabinan endo-1,5-alpha-L-arabinosidase